jgi:hypothetical protein
MLSGDICLILSGLVGLEKGHSGLGGGRKVGRRAARRWPGGGAPRGGEWGLGGPFHHATPSGRAIAADRAGEDRARGDGESHDKDRRGNEAHRHRLASL